MAKYIYPAVFTPAEEGGYIVTFPDWSGATQGEDKVDAMEAADDFLGLTCWTAEQEGYAIPSSTDPSAIAIPDGGFVNLIMADTVAYQEVIDRENNPIKYAMKKAGLNIKKLSLLLDAPYRTVQDWVAGKRMPPSWCQKLIIEKIETSA